MPISTYSDFDSRMRQLRPIYFNKGLTGSNATAFASSWAKTAAAGATPTTAAACDNTTIGALNLEDSVGQSSFDWRIARASLNLASTNQMVMVVDRLSHQGGLSGTTTGAQTTNLPTAALTRYTSGAGVFIGLEVYTSVGTTATTVTASYTNQAGTSGQTTQATPFGGVGFNAAGSLFMLPLQAGDTGVQSVQSVTLAASTLTAGNFGVTLFKPLAMFHTVVAGLEGYGTNTYNCLIGGGSQMEAIQPGACLSLLVRATSIQTLTGIINCIEAS